MSSYLDAVQPRSDNGTSFLFAIFSGRRQETASRTVFLPQALTARAFVLGETLLKEKQKGLLLFHSSWWEQKSEEVVKRGQRGVAHIEQKRFYCQIDGYITRTRDSRLFIWWKVVNCTQVAAKNFRTVELQVSHVTSPRLHKDGDVWCVNVMQEKRRHSFLWKLEYTLEQFEAHLPFLYR